MFALRRFPENSGGGGLESDMPYDGIPRFACPVVFIAYTPPIRTVKLTSSDQGPTPPEFLAATRTL